ncbi:TAP-like protein-domain-containing protein [Mycena albidolilacea]|uniref:TAP-like protein-domain-containing protein n=1 Tax=Mycena albidolilacea TaxID=1033008 RepID=A0AAD6ZKV1_9AGAR|nr:TAP-like protein-domain-containing protein [Mycena albidolilacea]
MNSVTRLPLDYALTGPLLPLRWYGCTQLYLTTRPRCVGPLYALNLFCNNAKGIGRSTLRVSFFASRAERAIWFDDFQKTSMNSSAYALPLAYARGLVEGQLAGERDDGSLRFINTDHTARDMLRIVQAHGLEKIQYCGFSYGSVLGATFASMFPDNGRLVIDGVVDSENYFAYEWSNNLIDTNKVWMAFVNGCVAAGPNGCPFFASAAAEILASLDKLYASLRARPIPVRTNTSFGIVDYSTLRFTIFRALYEPYALFPPLAEALADLTKDNATALFKMTEKPAFKCTWDPYCVAWPDFPKDHFQGPFVANTSFPLLLVGNTADPVTPLWAYVASNQEFNGSAVLTQDSAGHCSFSGPSICTQKYICQYFLNGTCPEPGTVCAVDVSPFPAAGSGADINVQAQAILGAPAEDRELVEAIWKLAKTFDFRFPAGIWAV